jgi:hypothetical protein
MILLSHLKTNIFKNFITQSELDELYDLANKEKLNPATSGYNGENRLLNNKDFESDIIKLILSKIKLINDELFLLKSTSSFILFKKNGGIQKHKDNCLRFLIVIEKADSGGEIIFENNELEINESDGLLFNGEVEHEVSTVTSDKELFVLVLSFEENKYG